MAGEKWKPTIDSYSGELLYQWSYDHAVPDESAALDALALYESFLSAIASCIRARLVARAMDGGDVAVDTDDAVFGTDRGPGHWSVMRWCKSRAEVLAIIHGTPADTAVEVVDTVLRLASEWSDR